MSRYLYFTLSPTNIPTHHLSEEIPDGPYLTLRIDYIWKIAQKIDKLYIGLKSADGKVVELNVIKDFDDAPNDQICLSLGDFLSDDTGELPTQPLYDSD